MKIATVEISRVGKSSWINQFRGLEQGDPAGATIGSPPYTGPTQVNPCVKAAASIAASLMLLLFFNPFNILR